MEIQRKIKKQKTPYNNNDVLCCYLATVWINIDRERARPIQVTQEYLFNFVDK